MRMLCLLAEVAAVVKSYPGNAQHSVTTPWRLLRLHARRLGERRRQRDDAKADVGGGELRRGQGGPDRGCSRDELKRSCLCECWNAVLECWKGACWSAVTVWSVFFQDVLSFWAVTSLLPQHQHIFFRLKRQFNQVCPGLRKVEMKKKRGIQSDLRVHEKWKLKRRDVVGKAIKTKRMNTIMEVTKKTSRIISPTKGFFLHSLLVIHYTQRAKPHSVQNLVDVFVQNDVRRELRPHSPSYVTFPYKSLWQLYDIVGRVQMSSTAAEQRSWKTTKRQNVSFYTPSECHTVSSG